MWLSPPVATSKAPICSPLPRSAALTCGYHQGPVRVIALAHVEQAGQGGPGQGPKVLVKDAELPAAQREDHGVGGHGLGQCLIVDTLALGAVTPARKGGAQEAWVGRAREQYISPIVNYRINYRIKNNT